jgi:hypothetical protein
MRQPERGLRLGSAVATFIRIAGLAGAVATANPAVDTLVLAAWRHAPRYLRGLGLGTLLAGTAQAVAVVCGGGLAALILHELGHYVAARAARTREGRAHRQPAFPADLRTRRHQAALRAGIGQVVLERQPTPGRYAIFVAAGPAANLLALAALLATPLPGSVKYPLALIFAATALGNLLPHRQRSGRLSDGAKLLRGRARSRVEMAVLGLLDDADWRDRPGAADLLLRGIRLEVPMARAHWPALAWLLHEGGRDDDLLALHRWPLTLPAKPDQNFVHAVHQVEWLVATIPDLPLADANLAGRRLTWVLKYDDHRTAAQHTLAVIRHRQGLPSEVEPLCAESLTADLEPGQRATVLATIAMARHASGQSGRSVLDEALALDPDAELVREAMALLGRARAISS